VHELAASRLDDVGVSKSSKFSRSEMRVTAMSGPSGMDIDGLWIAESCMAMGGTMYGTRSAKMLGFAHDLTCATTMSWRDDDGM
jgi:hypothetical protein